ncbi:hypothetical protein [Hymenobacter pini]|uniref:hypothetical protein n=1 Tax=Hymenobacter pini TaxID=2880879 RepID=UPI001CF11226|nr:hypothetical protein [Hymenobacter pini]MCA8831977.1 hypothetical protein [Hymenobacter pini]
MMRMVTGDGRELLLAGNSIGFEINNPYFEDDAIPGTTSLPFRFGWNRDNLRALGFPNRYRGTGGPAAVPVQLFVDGPLWKLGALRYKGCDEAKQQLTYNFVADAADLAAQIKGVRISDIDLGTVPFVRDNEQEAYALLPVQNTAFYGDKNKDFKGVLNYYGPGGYVQQPGSTHAFAPQPYFVPVLRQVLAHFGWSISGEFLDEPEIQALVIYSDRALEDEAGAVLAEVELARHVPEMLVADFLIAVQGLFTLGYNFNPQRRELRIRRLGHELARTDYADRAGRLLESKPNLSTGWHLTQSPDSNDELDKTLDTSWQELRLGAAGQKVQVDAGTLHMVRVEDALQPGRRWLLPAVESKGASAAYELGEDSRVGLRLLFNRGMQPDSQGNEYPLGSAANEDYAGGEVGQLTLHWDGPQGLYEQFAKEWLAFRSRAVETRYEVEFSLADLRSIDPGRLEMLDYHLRLWQQINVTIDLQRKLTKATIIYQEVR